LQPLAGHLYRSPIERRIGVLPSEREFVAVVSEECSITLNIKEIIKN
jgi:hypothetical protein